MHCSIKESKANEGLEVASRSHPMKFSRVPLVHEVEIKSLAYHSRSQEWHYSNLRCEVR